MDKEFLDRLKATNFDTWEVATDMGIYDMDILVKHMWKNTPTSVREYVEGLIPDDLGVTNSFTKLFEDGEEVELYRGMCIPEWSYDYHCENDDRISDMATLIKYSNMTDPNQARYAGGSTDKAIAESFSFSPRPYSYYSVFMKFKASNYIDIDRDNVFIDLPNIGGDEKEFIVDLNGIEFELIHVYKMNYNEDTDDHTQEEINIV